MEWSKVKNIIILLLLAVNGFLLVQTVGQARQSRQYREDARAGAVEVLRQQGYQVTLDALPEESALTPLTAERDRVGEEKMAEALLGEITKTDDSVRVAYEGEKGTCWFRGDGSFSFTFPTGAYPTGGGDEGAYGAKLLSGAGYSAQVLGVTGAEDALTVTLRQTWEGAAVFSCTAKLTYQGGSLTQVEGTRLVGTPVRENSGAETMDVPTVLVRFMAGMREGGHVFTRIDRLTSGYQTSGTGRRVQLDPMWQIVTDVGTFQMNAVTGEVGPE